MKKLIISLLFVFFLIPSQVFSQVNRTITLEHISSFTLNISADVEVKLGAKQMVRVEGTEDLIKLLNTETDNGHWSIKYTENNISPSSKLHIYLTVTELNSAKINSSGNITGEGTFNADHFSVSINGSGDLKMSLKVASLTVSINGSGDVNLSGNAIKSSIKINGSGDVNSAELVCNKTTININGSGDVKLSVKEYLEAKVNGSGDIRYTGDPDIKIRKNGSGTVKAID